MTSSKIENQRILTIFTWLFSAGILFQLAKDYSYILGSLSMSCSRILETYGVEARPLYLALMILIAAGAFARGQFRYVWLVTAFCYFIIFRQHVLCQTPENSGLPASNHIMPFWVFVTLGLTPLMEVSKSLFLLRFYLLFSYFAGGIAKIRYGLEWTNGYSLQYQFLQRHIFLDIPLAITIVSNLTVASVISWFVVITELSIPVVLLNKKIEYFYGFSFFIFQVICWFTLKLQFMQYFGWIYLIYVAYFLNRFIARRFWTS